MSEAQQVERLVEFDAENHIYYVNGDAWWNVTSVLKAAGAVNTDFYTEYGRWRGSASHKGCQLYDQDQLDRRTLDPAIKPRIQAWHLFRTRTNFVCRAIEEPVFDDTYKYAGTPDREGFFFNEPDDAVILEIKNFADGRIPDWVALQLAGYGRARSPRGIYRRIAVNLNPDGTYSLREFPLQEYLGDVNTFLAMLVTARWNAEH